MLRTERDHAREQGSKYAEVKSRPLRRYTDEELAEVYRLYAAENVRGATPRYWQDVTVGEALPKMAKGPMTVTGFIAYAQGWGGLYIRANKLWRQSPSTPGSASRPLPQPGIPDARSACTGSTSSPPRWGRPAPTTTAGACSWLTHPSPTGWATTASSGAALQDPPPHPEATT